MSKRKVEVSDWRWTVALEHADDGNLGELVRALLIVAPVPDWVREDLQSNTKFKDERGLSDDDRELLEVWRAYRTSCRNGEKSADRMVRVIREAGGRVPLRSLENVVNTEGRAYRRLRKLL